MLFKSSFHLLILIPVISASSSKWIEQDGTTLPAKYLDMFYYTAPGFVYQNLGNWTLRATSKRNYTFNSIKFDNENVYHAHIQYSFEGKSKIEEIDVKYVKNSKSFQFKWTSPESRNLSARSVMPIHMDGEYFVGFVLFPETKTEVLQIAARAELEFDAKYILELLYEKIITKKSVRNVIKPMINELYFMKPDVSGLYADAPIRLNDNELANATIEQITGHFNLFQTSDGIFDHDNIFVYFESGIVKTLRFKGTELVDTITHHEIDRSKYKGLDTSASALTPVKRRIDNLRSWPISIDEVYASNSTLILYEQSYNCETLRVYVRKGHTISDYKNGLLPGATSKLAHLLNKLSSYKSG